MIGHEWKLQRYFLFAFIFCLASLGFEVTAHADSSSVRAARLTYLQGTVTIIPPDNSGGVPAQLNLPLISGVQVATGPDGQAEIEFEDGSVARITPNSALSLDNLAVDPKGVFTTSLSLLRGLAYFELRATPQYLYSVNAGGDVLSPAENTTVRVNFDEPPAIFAVLDGTVQITRQNYPNGSDGYQTSVRAGESLRADPADASRYFLTQEIDQDSWDQWNEDQDQAAAAQSPDATSVRDNYEGAQGYGWSDLDADGSWYNVPGQGQVWQPDVAASDPSFDPYGDGAWVGYSGVGYVWASAYPWGWTPYRCGSWSYFNSFGWGWAPGASCGGLGWGFVGGGHPVNVVTGPGGYRPIRVPTPGHGPWRPLLPVRATNASQPPAQPTTPVQRGPRQIAGTTVSPIRPVGGGVTITNGSAVGSSLRRDFPVNSSTKAPVMGTASTAPAAVHTYRSSGGRVPGPQPPTAVVGPVTNPPPAVSYPVNPNPANNGSSRRGTGTSKPTPPANSGQFRPMPIQPSNQPAPANSGQFHPVPAQPSPSPAPANGRQFHPTPTARPQQPAPEAQRPPQQSAPVQRAEPQRSAPPSAPSRPSSSPPPAPSHPASSPPPASSSQGRSSPR